MLHPDDGPGRTEAALGSIEVLRAAPVGSAAQPSDPQRPQASPPLGQDADGFAAVTSQDADGFAAVTSQDADGFAAASSGSARA